jgi:biopolymer transport protein ExbB
LPNRSAQFKVAIFSLPAGDKRVLHIIQAAGWPIWILIVASVIALGIIVERAWSLQRSKIVPRDLLPQVAQEVKQRGVTQDLLNRLSQGTLLARIFAVGLRNVRSSREVMKESLEEAGRVAVHELERFLTTLGTIASLSPIMGLFGTVVGMIEIFSSQGGPGMSSNPQTLAHGISVALYNTAFGLIVAIPSMIFYRHYRAKVDGVVVEMETQAIKLVEIVHGERQQ